MATEINTDMNEDVNNRQDDLAGQTSISTSEDIQATIEKEKEVHKVGAFKLKAAVKSEQAEDIISQVEAKNTKFRESVITSKAGVKIPVADLNNLKIKSNTTLDFSTMNEDDVYNLDIPMSARPFSSEDSLKVSLRDTNYVARWVNKDNRRLGTMLGRGFSYVVKEDLASDLELEVYQDASGHYVLGDVICMKIQKEKYYMALRAAHLRAMNAINPKGAHKAAIQNATQFLDKETGGQYSSEHDARKIDIYSPNFTI